MEASFSLSCDKLKGEKDFRAIAAEPVACSSFTGKYEYDYADVARTTPL